MAETETSQSSPRPSKRRRVVLVLGAVALVLFVLVALTPTFIKWGLGRGWIEGQIENHVNGEVSIERLDLAWFGGQEIGGLHIEGDEGDTTVDADVAVGAGLFSFLFGSLDLQEVTLEGAVRGVRYADGSTSLQRLLKPSEEPSAGLPEGLRANFRVADLDVVLVDEETERPLAIEDLAGVVDFTLTDPIAIDLNGRTRIGEESGEVRLAGSLDGLFGPDGSFAPAGVVGRFDADLTVVPLAVVDGLLRMDGRLVALAGSRLESAAVRFEGDRENATVSATIDASRLSAEIAAAVAEGHAVVTEDAPAVVEVLVTEETLRPFLQAGADGSPLAGAELVSAEGTEAARAVVTVSTLSLPLPDENGLDLTGATVRARLVAENLLFRVADPAAEGDAGTILTGFDRVSVDAASDDLTDAIRLTLASDVEGELAEGATLSGEILARDLLEPDGRVVFDPANVSGAIRGENVPTAIVQAFAATDPLVLTRDVGPTADLAIDFGEGESREFTVALDAERLSMDLRARLRANEALVAEGGEIVWTVSEPLLASYVTSPVTLPRTLRVGIEEATLPLRTEEAGGGVVVDRASARATVALEGEPIRVGAGEGTPLAIRSFRSDVAADAGANEYVLDGELVADSGRVTFEQALALRPAEGEASLLDRLRPRGTIEAVASGESFWSRLPFQNADALASLLAGEVTATVATEPTDEGFQAAVTVRGGETHLRTLATRTPRAIRIADTSADLTVTPGLLASFQANDAEPIRLAGPARIQLTDASGEIPLAPDGSILMDETSFEGRVRATDLALENVPGLAEPIAFRDFTGAISGGLRPGSAITAEGTAIVARVGGDTDLAGAAYAVTLARAEAVADEDEPVASRWTPTLTLDLENVAFAEAERLVGTDLVVWTGETGRVHAELTPVGTGFTGELALDTPTVDGEFHIDVDDKVVRVRSEPTEILVRQAAFERFVNAVETDGGATGEGDGDGAGAAFPPGVNVISRPRNTQDEPAGDQVISAPRGGGNATDQPRETTEPPSRPADAGRSTVRVANDVRLVLDIAALAIPRALFAGEAIDPAAAEIDVELRAEDPLVLVQPDGGRAELRNLVVALNGENLNEGIAFGLTGDAASPEGGAGTVVWNGRVSRLVDNERRLAIDRAVLSFDLDAAAVPTPLIDAFANAEGLVAAALGPTVSAQARADELSFSSGRLTAELRSPNSRAQAKLFGANDALVTRDEEGGITGALALSPELRERFLERLHPILADVRSTQDPIDFAVTKATLPLDGDVSRLDATVAITTGPVEFESGSALLLALRVADRERAPTFPGRIEPILIRIEDGVVTYERFRVQIDRYTLAYRGRINLVDESVRLETEVPFEALASGINEIPKELAPLSVRLVTTGTFGNLETKLAPLNEQAASELINTLAQVSARRLASQLGEEDAGRQRLLTAGLQLALAATTTVIPEGEGGALAALTGRDREQLREQVARQALEMALRDLGAGALGGEGGVGGILDRILGGSEDEEEEKKTEGGGGGQGDGQGGNRRGGGNG